MFLPEAPLCACGFASGMTGRFGKPNENPRRATHAITATASAKAANSTAADQQNSLRDGNSRASNSMPNAINPSP